MLPLSWVIVYSSNKAALISRNYVEFQELVNKGETYLCMLQGVILFPHKAFQGHLLK